MRRGKQPSKRYHTLPGKLAYLTIQEFRVFRQVALGLSAKEIAHVLEVTTKTVEAHRLTMMRKLGVNDRVLIAHMALAAGVVEYQLPAWLVTAVGKQGAD